MHGSLSCAEQSLHFSHPCAVQICRLCSAHGREESKLWSAHGREPCRLRSAHGAETKFQWQKIAKIYISVSFQKLFSKSLIFREELWPMWPLLRIKKYGTFPPLPGCSENVQAGLTYCGNTLSRLTRRIVDLIYTRRYGPQHGPSSNSCGEKTNVFCLFFCCCFAYFRPFSVCYSNLSNLTNQKRKKEKKSMIFFKLSKKKKIK